MKISETVITDHYIMWPIESEHLR